MAKYTTKRTYTKKPSTQLKKVTKKIKKEVIEPVIEPTAETKSFWQKAVDWVKGIAG